MGDATNGLVVAMAVEIAELRQRLADAQNHLVEAAIDAGGLHARIMALRDELADTRAERDAWRVQAERIQLAG